MSKLRHPLRAYRFERNLTQTELARDMNLSTSSIHNLEHNNDSHPTVRRVLKYCRDKNLKPELFFPYD